MQSNNSFSRDFLEQIIEVGFNGYYVLGKGAVFIIEKDQGANPLFYLKQDYIMQIKEAKNEQKDLIINYLQKYDFNTEIIVFYSTDVLLLNTLDLIGKTSDDYSNKQKLVKVQKTINYPRE